MLYRRYLWPPAMPASYAGRRPFCFTAVVYFFIFAALSPRSLGRSSPNFVTCLMVIQMYKIRSEIWVAPSARNLAAQNMKFRRDFGQFHDLIANISETQQDIVSRKTALQLANYGHSRTGKLNSVYFGPQTSKNKTDRATGHSSSDDWS